MKKMKRGEMEPEIKVTKIADRWFARMTVAGEVRDEMACEFRCDIGWICREMLRWHQKLGGSSAFAAAARKRHTTEAKGRIWRQKDLRFNNRAEEKRSQQLSDTVDRLMDEVFAEAVVRQMAAWSVNQKTRCPPRKGNPAGIVRREKEDSSSFT